MRKYILPFTIAFFACISCSKEATESIDSFVNHLSKEELFNEFASILSIATSDRTDLREFLKAEALKRYDNDFDVFYPWAKDNIVSGTESFREILSLYDKKGIIPAIEEIAPLLTILVPEWSWVSPKCFSVLNWDTDNHDIAVCYGATNNECYSIYQDGKLAGEIQKGSFTDLPILILKENERMYMRPGVTKAGLPDYCFVDPAFDNTNPLTKDSEIYHYIYNQDEIVETDNYVDESELQLRIKDVYTVANGDDYFKQRDHIYYGMTPDNNEGLLNHCYKERLYKFKISSGYTPGMYDDTQLINPSNEVDYDLSPVYYYGNHAQGWGYNTVFNLWSEGALEVHFKFFAGSEVLPPKTKTVDLHEAFAIRKIKETTKLNWLRAVKYHKYTVDKSDLVPKWIMANYSLFSWDVNRYPTTYAVYVSEKDRGITYTNTHTETKQYMTNYTLSGNLDPSGNNLPFKVGLGYGGSATISRADSVSYTYTDTDDDWNYFYVEYTDKVFHGKDGNKYEAHVYSTGVVDVMMLPCYY